MENVVVLPDQDLNMKKSLAVAEIFDSIQGEGAFMGMPVTFVRLSGCHIKCPFCDSKETWKVKEPNMSTADIVEKCTQDIVVITGGEPCMQDLSELILILQENNKYVCMETSGDLPIPEGIQWVTCSPKKAVDYHIAEENYDKIGEYKFVVTPEFAWEEDVQPVIDRMIAAEAPNVPGGGNLWMQPCDAVGDNGAQRAQMWKKCYEITMQHKCRVGIQLHKYMDVR